MKSLCGRNTTDQVNRETRNESQLPFYSLGGIYVWPLRIVGGGRGRGGCRVIFNKSSWCVLGIFGLPIKTYTLKRHFESLQINYGKIIFCQSLTLFQY